MNTPHPCDKCKFCKYSIFNDKEPAWCEKDMKMGNVFCKGFKLWENK